MTALFIRLIEMSLAASIVALAVMLIKLPLKKAPRWIHCLMWTLVAVRLILPVTFESKFSLMPELYSASYSTDLEQNDQEFYSDAYASNVHGSSGTVGELPVTPDNSTQEQLPSEPVDDPVNIGGSVTPDDPKTESPAYVNDASTKEPNTAGEISFTQIASAVWLAGAVIMVLYGIGSWVVFKRKVAASVHFADKIYVCDYIDSPFILGVIRPRIYIPSSLDESERELVIAHEMAHIKRGDHIYKPLGFLLLSLHWFNPIVWISYALLCRDIEIACDERAIKDMDPSKKKEYVKVLLDCSISRRKISACPLAFGEVSVKDRIKNVLNYKKPTIFVLIAAVVVITVLAAVLLTDPKKNDGDAAAPSATEAPETEAPETDAPETDAPETEAPETEAPEAEAPETEAPETEAPETDVPETDAPETDAPETDAPETDAPETDAPETDAPETDAPETDAPETDAPETDAPETDAPETDAPETDAPETDAPETEAPETDAPETDAAKEALANFGYYTYTASNGLTIPYRMYVPKDYTWRNDYPVLMIFHSKDYCGTDNEKQMTEVEKFFGSDDSPALDCIVIVPQLPNALSNNLIDVADTGLIYINRNDSWKDPGVEAAIEIFDVVNKKYSTDKERQYVVGFDSGGTAVWNALCRFPEKISAAIICAAVGGFIPESYTNDKAPIITKFTISVANEESNSPPEWLNESSSEDVYYLKSYRRESLCIPRDVLDIPVFCLFEIGGGTYKYIIQLMQEMNNNNFKYKDFGGITKEELGATYISEENGYKYLDWLLKQRRETE